MSQAWTTMLGRRIQAGDRGAPAGDAVVDAAPGLAERVALMVIFPLTILLRSFYVFRHGFDSDEWQHLHVVWAATRGLTQYRDVFDNHAPLFHILSVPLVASLGETPDILYVMRLAITPFVVITLWATCLMGRSIGGRPPPSWASSRSSFFGRSSTGPTCCGRCSGSWRWRSSWAATSPGGDAWRPGCSSGWR